MVSSCSSEASKPLTLSRSLSRGGSAADLLSELTLGFATWMPIPRSARFMQRQRSDSAESDSSSTTSGSSDNDTRSSSGVSSPTDVSSMSKRIMKEACSRLPDFSGPMLENVVRSRKTTQSRKGESVEPHKVESRRNSKMKMEKKEVSHGDTSKEKSLWPCFLYGACACMIHLCNKGFFQIWQYKGTFVFSLAQSIVTCVLFAIALALGQWRLPDMRWQTQRGLLLLPLLFVCNTSFALIGLQHTCLPMYLVLRRMVTPAVLLSEYLVWGRSSSPGIMSACALLFLGSVVAGASDLKIDLFGYACTTIANVFTVAYTMYMKELSRVTSAGQVHVTDIIFFNALYSIPLLLAAAIFSGELQAAAAYPHLSSPLFQASLLGASAMGILYQAAMVLANTRTSPLATSIAGNVKDVACSAVGYMLFESGPISPANMVGLSMSMSGAFWYVALKTNLVG